MDNQNNRNSNRNNQNDNKNNKPNRQGVSFVLLIALITTFLVLSLYQFQKTSSAEEITYDKFLNMIKHHKVQEVTISSDKIMIKAKKEKGETTAKEYYTGVVDDNTLSERLYEAGIKYEQEIPDTTSMMVLNVIAHLPADRIDRGDCSYWSFKRMSKGGGMMGIGKSNAKMYVEKADRRYI